MALRRGPAVLLTLLLCGSNAAAQEAPPEPGEEPVVEETAEDEETAGFVQRLALGIRVNPIGISVDSDTAYTIPFYDSDSFLLDGSHIDMGIAASASPSFILGGPFIEIVPVAFLKLRGSFQPMFYFGTFATIYEFDENDTNWSPDRLDQIKEEGLESSAYGWRADAIARLQVKAGPVVIMGESQYVWVSLDAEKNYYDSNLDLFMAPDEQVWLTTAVAGYVFGGELDDGFLLLGARWQRQATKVTDVSRHLLTALWIWDIPDAWWSWGDPKLVGIFGLYLEDPYVEHEPHFGTRLILTF